MRESTPTQHAGGFGNIGASLRTIFSIGTQSGLTDGQLLERFAQGRVGMPESEAAFTALVERHGPMVLGVCRAVLRDRHDAEDACQATFLVLAQRAGLIRRRNSVASWLYGVARRVALRARREAARRREQERRRRARVGVADRVSQPPAEPWPELYEELDRLPEPFRAAVVLCDLEGHSYEQAAGILHCPVGTLKSRLARGRKRLRHRLERLGLAPAFILTGSGTGPTAPSATAALSPQLITSIARAAIDTIARRGIAGTAHALAGAEIRRHIMIRLLTGLTAFMLTGLIAATTIGLAIVGRNDAHSEPQQSVEATQRAGVGPIHVRVVDNEGAIAPGVAVDVHTWSQPRHSFPTDAQGRGAIPRDVLGDRTVLVARRAGESLAWAALGDGQSGRPAGTEKDPILMKLLPLTHRVEGSVVDQAGKPIAGVEVDVTSFPYPIDGMLHFHIEKTDRLLAPAITDNTGRFVLMLPEGVGAGLRASHPLYFGPGTSAKADLAVLDPLILEPGGRIAGTVTDATGGPVEGVRVGAQLLEHRVRILGGYGEGVSGEQGRFLVGGLEPGVYNLLFQGVPGHDELTARAVEGLRVLTGAETPANLTVIRGRPLRGVVIDRETDKPVADILVGCYGPAHPRSGAAVEAHKTDAQGRFTFHVPSGEQHIYIMEGMSSSRLSRRDLFVPEQGEIESSRLVRTAPENHGPREVRYQKAEGRPLSPAGAKFKDVTKVAARAVKRELPVRNPAKGKVTEEEEEPAPKVRTITGHVRDPKRRPLVGVSVYVNPRPGGPFERFDSAATDRDGMFLLNGLPRRPIQINLSYGGLRIHTEDLPTERDQVEFTYPLGPVPRDRTQPALAHDEPIPQGLRERVTFVDLDRRGNDFLADGPGGNGNDLDRLPRGIHRLGDVYFHIGEKMVHVRGRMRPDLPSSVKGIPVRARADRVHFLHATQGGKDPGTLIGAYLLRYADGTSEQVPLVYGRNIANWWSFPIKDDATEAKTHWTGSNDVTDLNPGVIIRLSAITWTNPHPEREITALDVLSSGNDCDPFLAAMTLSRQ
jgi:RNA polymerase sigma factor (sigma-70 family)